MLRIALLLLGLLIAATASAATYRGRSVDGQRFSASITNEDFGSIPNVEVKFWGRSVTVLIHGRSLNLQLDEDEINDPRHIAAHDDLRGFSWEIDVRNLREASEGSGKH